MCDALWHVGQTKDSAVFMVVRRKSVPVSKVRHDGPGDIMCSPADQGVCLAANQALYLVNHVEKGWRGVGLPTVGSPVIDW